VLGDGGGAAGRRLQSVQPVPLHTVPAAAQHSGRTAANRIVVEHPGHAHSDIGIVWEAEAVASPVSRLDGQGVQGVRQALAGVDVTVIGEEHLVF